MGFLSYSLCVHSPMTLLPLNPTPAENLRLYQDFSADALRQLSVLWTIDEI